jgi:tRNA pseudouridine38-40 synthase
MQSNTDKPCIQEVIQNTLSKITGTKTMIMGCGRTDAGVHAAQYFFHFDGDDHYEYDWVERMNRNLPDDIVVFDLLPAPHAKAHTRYDATSRTYHYHLHHEAHPYYAHISTVCPLIGLDIESMMTAIASLVGIVDCAHLCIAPERVDNTICQISVAEILLSDDGKRMQISITANRFLKSMIRIIVARMLAVGEGRITIDDFKSTMTNTQLFKWRKLAPPQGLHLVKIEYPYFDIATRQYYL